MGSVKEIATGGRAILRFWRLGITALAAYGLLTLAAGPALATHLGDPEGVRLANGRISYVAGLGPVSYTHLTLPTILRV